MATLQQHLVDFQMLKRDAQTTEQLYQALLARMKETTVASTMVPSNVAVIDSADLPAEPYLPKKGLFLSLAGVIGLCLGLSAAFLAEYLDDTLKTAEEVERVCQVPSLGLIPLLAENGVAARHHHFPLPGSEQWLRRLPFRGSPDRALAWNRDRPELVVLNQPRSVASEAFRQVRTSLMLSAAGGPPKTIIVTSPSPQEGKSTIAANLAASLALDGRQVAVLDCDLRKPRLHQVFRVPGQPGLTNYLAGQQGREEILRPTQVPNLYLIPAGPVPPSPAELLNSEAFRQLLLELAQQFQSIVIDTPPALGFADARVLSRLADGVLLVMKHHATPREAGRLTCQLFSKVQAPLLGIILNQVDSNGLGGYGYYYSTKYYENYVGGREGEGPGSGQAGQNHKAQLG